MLPHTSQVAEFSPDRGGPAPFTLTELTFCIESLLHCVVANRYIGRHIEVISMLDEGDVQEVAHWPSVLPERLLTPPKTRWRLRLGEALEQTQAEFLECHRVVRVW